MDYVRQFCRLHQAFTSDRVVRHMWSLAPQCRTDEVYGCLLRELDPLLCTVPWARTGVAPDGTRESDSRLERRYHDCPRWLHDELRPRLEPLVFSPGLAQLGVFWGPAIHQLWSVWLEQPVTDRLGLAQNIVQLASLEISRRHYDLQPCRRPTRWSDSCKDFLARANHRVRRALGLQRSAATTDR
jgi:hypothetical protein